MKQTLHFLLFSLLPIIGYSQAGTTIFYDDNFGDGGTINYAGDVNGRPSYSGPANGVTVTVTWSSANSRWEIDLAPPGAGLTFINTSDSQNPPDLNLGTWVNLPMDGTVLEVFSGTGTTNVLPVELIFFKARILDDRITLNWRTATEINNEKFEIEESQNGREFRKVREIKGNGTTLEQQDYSFDVENPQNGVSYFRLKQIDFDGQFEYSEVISVDFKGDDGEVGNFYPNPSKLGMVNLNYITQNDYEITVSVFDMAGKLVVNQIQSISRGNNNLSFDFSELNTGIYIVKIGAESNSVHRKLIIER